jgi:hypothetical protein
MHLIKNKRFTIWKKNISIAVKERDGGYVRRRK